MNNQFKDDIIDLTSSFTLADHCALSNMIIDLDDSIDINCEDHNDKKKSKKDNPSENSPHSFSKINSNQKTTSNRIGHCPICWDELGTNPLAATKCGHVFCIRCLEDSLHIKRQCPTCRVQLKGKSAYHPLYLS